MRMYPAAGRRNATGAFDRSRPAASGRRTRGRGKLPGEAVQPGGAMEESGQGIPYTQRVKSLFALGTLVAAAESESDVLAVIVHEGAELAGAAGAVVGMVSGDEIAVVADHGYPDGFLDPWQTFPLLEGMPMSDVIRTGEAAYCSSRAERDRRWPIFRGVGLTASEAFVVLPLAARGGPIGALTLSYLERREFEADERELLEGFAAQCALALARARATAAERVARMRTERLQRFTARLAPALMVDDVAAIAVDKALIASRGATAMLALATTDGRQFEIRRVDGVLAETLRTDRLFSLAEGSVVSTALRERTALWLGTRGEWERYPQTIGRPDILRSVAVLPVAASGRFFGALSIAFDRERDFPPDERTFLSAIAAQTAQALDRARLYEEQSNIAKVLQASLLPRSFPSIPGIRVATAYHAAGELNQVGGDFYDLIATGAGHMLVIGDVCGKGPEAAALTSLCRYTLRAGALDGRSPDPAHLLALLNRAIAEDCEEDSRFASVTCVLLERGRDGVSARLASAGHPPTLVRRQGGAIVEYGAGGPPAGLVADGKWEEHAFMLDPGDLILLYTDGLTDARTGSNELLGQAPIRRTLASLVDGTGPDEAIAALEELLAGLSTADDIAIVAAVVTDS